MNVWALTMQWVIFYKMGQHPMLKYFRGRCSEAFGIYFIRAVTFYDAWTRQILDGLNYCFSTFLHTKINLLEYINFNVLNKYFQHTLYSRVGYNQKLQNYVFNLTHDTACDVVEHLWSMKREFIGNTIKVELFAEGVHGLFWRMFDLA